jgi:hypothetical protein
MNISLSCCHVVTTIACIYNILGTILGASFCSELLIIIIIIIIIIQNLGLLCGQSAILYLF